MFASIVIVILGILFGSLSIFAQYTKDRERRKKSRALCLFQPCSPCLAPSPG